MTVLLTTPVADMSTAGTDGFKSVAQGGYTKVTGIVPPHTLATFIFKNVTGKPKPAG